jgi:hypothetical protein
MAVKNLMGVVGGKVLIDFAARNRRILVVLDGRSGIAIHDDKCRHRGGPLHLCLRDAAGVRRCPWHGRAVPQLPPADDVSIIMRVSSQTMTLVADYNDSLPWPVHCIV